MRPDPASLTRRPRAFTLLELTVTLVIVSVIALVAIPTYLTVTDNSERTTAETTAMAVGRDAVALAASGGDAPQPAGASHVSTTAGEADASSVVLGGGQYQVTTAAGATACINIEQVVNGAVTAIDCP